MFFYWIEGEEGDFFFFDILEGGLRKSYVEVIVCDFYIVIFGLYEKMDFYGLSFLLIGFGSLLFVFDFLNKYRFFRVSVMS